MTGVACSFPMSSAVGNWNNVMGKGKEVWKRSVWSPGDGDIIGGEDTAGDLLHGWG